jgi:hypothetical protein
VGSAGTGDCRGGSSVKSICARVAGDSLRANVSVARPQAEVDLRAEKNTADQQPSFRQQPRGRGLSSPD